MSGLGALIANAPNDESATMHGQTGVAVGHEDLLGCDDGNLRNAPEVFAISATCHQRPGRVHLAAHQPPVNPGSDGAKRRYNQARNTSVAVNGFALDAVFEALSSNQVRRAHGLAANMLLATFQVLAANLRKIRFWST